MLISQCDVVVRVLGEKERDLGSNFCTVMELSSDLASITVFQAKLFHRIVENKMRKERVCIPELLGGREGSINVSDILWDSYLCRSHSTLPPYEENPPAPIWSKS